MAVLESALRTTGPIFMRLEGCLSRGVVAGEAMVDDRRARARMDLGAFKLGDLFGQLAVRCENADAGEYFRRRRRAREERRRAMESDERGIEIGSKVTASRRRWPGRGSGRARLG